VLDLDDPVIESAATVAGRIREALKFVAPQRLVIAPDCGMKYIARDVAQAKLSAMVEGARIVRNELG
jgi:5-methyltetrahydropteroyltriglutamate--homocysteine methyltransferase